MNPSLIKGRVKQIFSYLKLILQEYIKNSPKTLPKKTKTPTINILNLLLKKGKKQDELVDLLSKEPDFRESKPLLVEEMEKVGAEVLFGVKFHPEFMPVEACYR